MNEFRFLVHITSEMLVPFTVTGNSQGLEGKIMILVFYNKFETGW